MRKIHFIFLLLVFSVACVTKYHYKYDKVDQLELEKRTRTLAKTYNLKDNEMWLIFFTGFEKTPIKIKENGQLKFDSIVTSSKHYPFMADAFKIRKDAIIEISTQSFSKPLILEPASMAGYKSVYISKARQKVEIHFTDSNKPITEQRKQDSILIAKFRRKSSRDLLKEVKDSITDSIYINKRQR